MNKDKNLSLNKYLLISNIINNNTNKKLFDYFDGQLLIKRFNYAQTLSVTENILTIETLNLKPCDINKIIKNFIKNVKTNTCLKSRSLFEIAKISNLSEVKLKNTISDDTFLILGDNLQQVSRETNFISYDFSILRSLDNFIIKIKNPLIQNKFNAIRKDIIRKIINFDYLPEKKETKVNYLCWVDRVLNAILKQEINLFEFVKLNEKIFKLIDDDMDVIWKILHTVNYLSFQPYYKDSADLRKFKRYITKIISEKYKLQNFTQQKTEDLMLRVLSNPNISKEDFYYLFDVIDFVSQKSEKDKIFCFNLCEYILYINKKQNIFCYRFIREAFINMLYKMIKKDDDINLKERELCLFISLFHTDSFFYLNKTDIFEKMVELLSDIHHLEKTITRNKFYKYCDIFDYILTENRDIKNSNIIKNIALNDDDYSKISKRFKLCTNAGGL